MRFLLASSNAGKLREIRDLTTQLRVEWVGLATCGDVEMPEEIGETFVDNAILKAAAGQAQSGIPAMADDSGLCVDALDGAPGVHSARFAGSDGDDQANNALLLQRLEGLDEAERTARFRCVIALVALRDHPLTRWSPSADIQVVDEHRFLGSEQRAWIATGSVEGHIVETPVGDGGFGYDPLFFHVPSNMTFGQLASEQKNQISHRAHAVRSIVSWLGSGSVTQ